MKLPDKLIMVGMKYQSAKAVNAFRNECRCTIRGTLIVDLQIERNNAGEFSSKYPNERMSYAVYATLPGMHNVQVGYIRNADLSKLGFNESIISGKYCVTTMQVNYIVLELLDQQGNTRSEVVNNPWGEVVINTNKQTDMKETKMNTNSMRDSFFREVKNVVIDIQSGKMGVTSKDGIATFANGSVNVNPLVDFGVKIPAFAMRVELTALKEGDIIVNGEESTFFKELTEGGYSVVTLAGEVRQVGSVSNMFFGKNTVLAVKNMFGEGTNPMMMALLMGDEGFGGKGGDNKNLMLAMAMSGGMGGNSDAMGGMNPMMMMLLMNK